MKITYIHHSGLSVEMKEAVFLFDYFQGELPDFDREKPLFVLTSHFHGDHYSPVIFDLMKKRGQVRYILSQDIRGRQIPPEAEPLIRFVKPGEKIREGKNERISIQTYRSTDEGVAFWVETEGAAVYHAGDLNNWWWEGEDKAWNHNMAASYRHELETIGKDHPEGADVAFVPLDPRQEQWYWLGMDEFMKTVGAKKVFPIHFWKDYGLAAKMKQRPESSSYSDRIVEIHREGEEFEL